MKDVIMTDGSNLITVAQESDDPFASASDLDFIGDVDMPDDPDARWKKYVDPETGDFDVKTEEYTGSQLDRIFRQVFERARSEGAEQVVDMMIVPILNDLMAKHREVCREIFLNDINENYEGEVREALLAMVEYDEEMGISPKPSEVSEHLTQAFKTALKESGNWP